MKKALVLVLVIALAATSVFASDLRGASEKDSFKVGLNLGTNAGVAFNYGMGKFDLETIVGFGFINRGLDVEVAANYEIVDVAKECKFSGFMPFTVGGEIYLSTDFNHLGLGVLVPLKLTYTFEDVPVSLYLRVAPGLYMRILDEFKAQFGIQASIGATYNF